MPSEQRLHPASILFALAGSLKALAVPALLLMLGTSRSSGAPGRFFGAPQGNWEVWAMFLLIPATGLAIARYLSFRLRYDESEIVIRTGIVFRNERHVPYARIQNLGAVRNVFHRLLGVTEVRVETGGGREVEATISVVPVAAFEEMRRRVFEARAPGRDHTGPAARAETAREPAEDERTLLRLPVRELVLHGLIENRSLLVIGALAGLLWELGLLEGVADRVFGDRSYGRGVIRDVLRAVSGGARLPVERMLPALAVAAGVLAAVQFAWVAWVVTRLHGFRVTRAGEDLRTEFGLFTRVTSTIPLRRVQTMTMYEGPLQRLVGRMSVRVETAGGVGAGGGTATREREWIAPIVRPAAVAALTREILPEFEPDRMDWHPVHPRAFRRAVKRTIAGAVTASVVSAAVVGSGAILVFAVALPWAVIAARKHVRHLGWAVDEDVVVFRSGWIWRRVTVVRVVKVQAVMVLQSPFDRRTAMARVRVDTAGASERSHRVDVPYLPSDVARGLYQHLAAKAASTVFRW